jgi:hypothetical protein
VKYVLNESDSLAVLGDERFDLVYTDLVLQHLPPDLAMKYLRELLERVAPGGVIVFQLPSVRRPVQRPTPSPLRDDAYHAAIELIAGECSMTGASDFVIKVTNSSKSTWSNGVFRLGNHWLDEAGAMLVQDDARAGLPAPFHPGQVAVVTLTPAEPPGAAAILEFDVVHEGLTWFSDKGSPTLRLRAADVVAASGGAAADALQPHHLFVPGIASDEAVSFPMHGVRRDEVERLISEAGMSLVLAEVDERGGPEWEGYRYFVRRRL